jgi:creatinine deaminase
LSGFVASSVQTPKCLRNRPALAKYINVRNRAFPMRAVYHHPRGSKAQMNQSDYISMLQVALEEARLGFSEGGVPVGAALFTSQGQLLGRGRNRRVQQNDPSVHGETDAFRAAGRQRSYRDKIMVTTLAPCWYCSGLIRQFRIGTLVVGESRTFSGGLDWLRKNGVQIIDLDNAECHNLMERFIAAKPEIWNEDIGED